MKRYVFPGMLVVLCAFALGTAFDARAVGAPGRRTATQVLNAGPPVRTHARPVVRGEDQPDLIPADIAFHFFLRSVAVESRTGPAGPRLEAFAKHIGFSSTSDPEFQKLIEVSRSYVTAIQNDISSRSTQNNAPPNGFAARRAALVARAQAQLASSMDGARAARLNAYVLNTVRKRVSISQ